MTVDWDATGSMLQGWGSLGSIAAIVYAAWKGTQTFENWRAQRVAERRQDQAEKILVATHRAKDLLAFVRSGVIWGHELEAAEVELKEDPRLWNMAIEPKQRRLVKAQALLNRLNRGEEVQRDLVSTIPYARAHFGEELEQALTQLHRQFWLFQVDLESYVSDNGEDAEFTRTLLIGIGDRKAAEGEPDQSGEAIRASCSKIEEICNPALTLQS